jgi:hypothetical protein
MQTFIETIRYRNVHSQGKWFSGFSLYMVVALATATLHANTGFPQYPQKLWSVDLAANRDFQKRLSVLEVSLDAPSIHFLSNSQIICDFYDGEKGGYNLSMPPSGYHVLEIEANSGKFGRQLNFQPVDDHSRSLPMNGGDFVVFTGRELKKFDSELAPVISYPTQREQVSDVLDRWLVDVAPSLQTILVYHGRPGDTQGRWTWLRAKDLAIGNNIQGPLAMMVQASDTGAIFGGGINEMQLLSVAGKSAAICARCNAYFLSDDLIFVDEGKSYTIETITGENRRKGDLGIGGGKFAQAAHSPRFAYVTGGIVGSGFPIQTHFDKISGKIRVWDWTTNKVIAQMDVNEPAGNPSAGLTQMALALSPDGKYLAVLLHHTLTLYLLP